MRLFPPRPGRKDSEHSKDCKDSKDSEHNKGCEDSEGTAPQRSPRSLRARLAAGTLGIMLVVAALMGAVSTLTLRHTLMDRLDDQLIAASERAANRRHGGAHDGKTPQSSCSSPTSTPPAHQDDAGNAGDADNADGGDGEPRLPPGLDAAGQPTGTLSVIVSGKTDSEPAVRAGYIDEQGSYQTLAATDYQDLLALPTGQGPTTVRIGGLGDYRVLAIHDNDSGDLVITGLSMKADNALVRTQLLIEGFIALGGAVVAALAGRAMVRSSLAPLERVAATAKHVASQPLERGEVSINERVTEADLASSQEVGQVGGALNTLLNHVDAALAVRHRSETQVRQFVADASHELRTPLASIRGYTELIAREGADADLPERATHALGRVHSESVRMTALVEDLLLLARLDAGRELRREEVDLVGLLVDTVADARAAGPDHEWALELTALEPPAGPAGELSEVEDFEPEPPLVMGDEARLRQVLVNLLANARVHTPAGSRVTTTLKRSGATLVITVADDGPGIDPQVRERLFERFARGDSSRGRRTGSTGLGMSIALAIVRSHGGTLTVDSRQGRADGEHGTTFTVTLPAAEVS